jgi:asparagine synthase (glutamine-hydrolysing)
VCGIAGVLDPHPDQAIDPAALERATKLLHHRGPDGSDVWVGPGAALAHTRLAIIDIEGGGQPMHSEDGRYVVVFNGEIYNHRDLRSELEAHGARFRTRCDTEVLLHLYARHGANMVGRLRGMFAFVVVDLLQRHALLARDRFGKKPLCYAERDGRLTFASTLDALVTLLPVRPGLDMRAIAEYLVLQYVPAPLTPYEGVRKLEPGCVAEWRDGRLEVTRYWSAPLGTRPSPNGHAEDVTAELRARLRAAVSARLEADVPLGVFLSGGLDSSVVVAEMAALGAAPKSYSVAFRDPAFDESPYARQVAKRFGADHHDLIADEGPLELFRAFTRAYDEPFADHSALATLGVAHAASEHVKVVLTGDGGDELFGGYERYGRFAQASRIRRRLGPVAPVALAATSAAGRGLGRRRLVTAAAYSGDPWPYYRDLLFRFRPDEVPAFVEPEALSGMDLQAPRRRLDALWERAPGPTSTLVWIDAHMYLPDDLLMKMDRATMAYGLEARSPFLDHELAAFAASLPEDLLFANGAGKAIVREAYRHVLPAEVLERRKQGLRVPIATWLRGALAGDIDELLLSRDGPLDGWLLTHATTALVERFRAGDDDARLKVWSLLALAGWASERGISTR